MDGLENDGFFWIYGRPASIGNFGGVWLRTGLPDGGRSETVLVCYLSDGQDFPTFLKSVFRRHFFSKATCVKCFRPMVALQFRTFREHNRRRGALNTYIACDCGHPVWRIEANLLGITETSLREAIKSSRRRQRMKTAGGRHSSEEIEEILRIQQNRCFYCNRGFRTGIRWEKDHLLSLVGGGTHWALNIVLSCKRCNSRRCDIPFRTYCKLLSPTQNRRMLKCLYNRLLALDPDNLSGEALDSFNLGLAEHDPHHWRYIDIQRRYPTARLYAEINPLFPRSINLILKRPQK